MKIAIITICFNAEKQLKQTIQSVISQDYTDYEFIIIDGDSHDGTRMVVEKYKNYVSAFVSERDKGIYDAMNKGIKLVTGKWIIFMNAGDTFANMHVLSDVVPYLDEQYDIIYGSTLMTTAYGKYIQKPLSLSNLKQRMIFCHQSCFVKSQYHKEKPFDISFKSSGDYHFFYNAYMDSCHFREIPVLVANFDAIYGISSVKFLQPKKEDLKIWKQDKNWIAIFNMYVKVFISYTRHKIVTLMPHRISVCIGRRKIQKLQKTND